MQKPIVLSLLGFTCYVAIVLRAVLVVLVPICKLSIGASRFSLPLPLSPIHRVHLLKLMVCLVGEQDRMEWF